MGIFVYVILGILGFCFLLWVLYKCFELAEDDDYQETNTYRTEGNTQPKYELNSTRVDDAKLTAVYLQRSLRQENNFNPGFNPAFNPMFNPAVIELPPNPEYEARNNFPSSFQINTYGSNNHITSSSNLPYSLTPGEVNGTQTGSEPSYAGGWVNQS